jgi:UDP-arabinose 4-epimerase
MSYSELCHIPLSNCPARSFLGTAKPKLGLPVRQRTLLELSSMTILVTGGAGYIGSHVCKLLATNGILPIAYDNLSRGHAHAVKWGPLVLGDLEDQSKLTEVIHAYRIDAIIHFAAFTYVGESVTDPTKYYRNNVVSTLALVEAMLQTGIYTIVFSSSVATFGDAGSDIIDELTPQSRRAHMGGQSLS